MLFSQRDILIRIPKLRRRISHRAFSSTAYMASIYGPSTDVSEFHEVLKSSKRILALCGAGLSAASGLGTFRGAGGMWRNHQATSLATPEAFEQDPGLVWLFYSYRRHKALQAKPNAGHYALTELSKKLPDGFITLTQNVDGKDFRLFIHNHVMFTLIIPSFHGS
jgi:NAD-dependent SIR2 family protein deacetylase